MKKYIFSAAAIVLAVIGSAFTNAKRTNTWVFQGSTSGQSLIATNYQENASEPSGCGSGSSLPCSIQVTAADHQELQDFLDTKTADQVRAMSSNKRN